MPRQVMKEWGVADVREAYAAWLTSQQQIPK